MAKWSSQGTVVEMQIACAWVVIPNILEAPWASPTAQYEDTSDLATEGAKEYTPTLNDVAELTARFFFDPTNSAHDTLMDESILGGNSKALIAFRVTLPDSGSAQQSFFAYVSRCAPQPVVNQALRGELGLRQTGTITYTA